MRRGWHERRTYVRSLGRSVAPKHRQAALRRTYNRRRPSHDFDSTHARRMETIIRNAKGKRFKQTTLDRRVKIDRDDVIHDPFGYLQEEYDMPRSESQYINFPSGRDMAGRQIFSRADLDAVGKWYISAKLAKWQSTGKAEIPGFHVGGVQYQEPLTEDQEIYQKGYRVKKDRWGNVQGEELLGWRARNYSKGQPVKPKGPSVDYSDPNWYKKTYQKSSGKKKASSKRRKHK